MAHSDTKTMAVAFAFALVSGAALASGMGVSTFREKFDGNMTPMSHMLKVLMSKRYEEVHA